MEQIIVTAASEKYADSLYSLIGSLNCNWPTHPPIRVYDLGLSSKTIEFLTKSEIEVLNIDPFCQHWREHYTWKVWCICEQKAEIVIWMDAGVLVLEPLDEILRIAKEQGYFIVPNYQFLDYEASMFACKGCGVDYNFRLGKGSVAATFMVFRKNNLISTLLEEALSVVRIEEHIKAVDVRNKHDQAIISLLIYKYFPNPSFNDGNIYLGWKSPRQVDNQKIWLQRRAILKEDVGVLKSSLISKGVKFVPKDPIADISFIRRCYRHLFVSIKSILRLFLLKKSSVNNGLR